MSAITNSVSKVKAVLGALGIALMAMTGTAAAQSFGTCDSRMFLDDLNAAFTSSRLNNVNVSSVPVTLSPLGAAGTARNALAYNPVDNFLYSIAWGTNTLNRHAASGAVTSLGAVSGLPTGLSFSAGAMAPNGDYYVKENAGSGAYIYRINVVTRVATRISLYRGGLTGIQIADLAWYNGALYAIENGRLVRIVINAAGDRGDITNIGSTGIPGLTSLTHSMWSFSNGLLTYFNNGLYVLDPATGVGTLISTTATVPNGDGASCAAAEIKFQADLSVTKTNTPASGPNDLPTDTYVPGETRTYTMVVTNNGTFGAQNVSVSDPLPSGITAANWTCVGAGGGVCQAASGSGAINHTGVNLPSGATVTYRLTLTVPTGQTGDLTNTVTVTPGPMTNDTNLANNTAIDTDVRQPTVTIAKVSQGGVGSFSFTGTNGLAATQAITTTVAGTAVNGAMRALTTVGGVTTITESAPPAGFALSAIACTGLGTGGTATNNLGTRTVTLDAAATAPGSNITCTFTNNRLPVIRLQKALPGGRFQAGDQFTLSMGGTGAPAAVTTTGTGSTATGTLTHSTATVGATYTLTEAAAGTTALTNYTSTYSCANALSGGQTPSGSGTSFSVTPVAGDDLTCTFTNTAAPVQPNFGTCDARMFLDQTNGTATSSTLYNVGYASTPFTYTALGSGAPRNGIGYNPLDNYIYGIEWGGFSGNELIRVGSDGSSTNLGVITGLPVTNYNNGVISPAGDYYVTQGFGGTALYRINIAARTATATTMSRSIAVSDLAWLNGLLYGVDNGVLYSISPVSGAVTSIGSTAPITTAISMWGFTNGLFASGGGPIYSIDPTTGAATLLSSAPTSANADGANCPAAAILFNADLSVTKTNTPAQGPNDLPDDMYTPGEVRTYTIVVSNSAGSFGAQNVTVSDPIPAGIVATTVSWTCTSTSGGAVCGAASGTGALNDTRLALPPGAVATYRVTMTVPASFTGNLTNTVTITPPNNINDTNLSNNTATDTDFQAKADLSVVKTASPPGAVPTGSVITYTLTVLNAGPSAANGAVLRDTPGAGLNCAVPSTTATCTASGSAVCPVAPLTVAALTSPAGVTIPTLPSGGGVVVVMQCTVTANGLP